MKFGSVARPLLLWVLVISMCLPVAAQRPARALTTVLSKPYQKWLDEDARYIITDQELADFRRLTTDQQRDDFIERFWERRNPNPGTTENTFKEEHYRRIAYANNHFAASVPGYKTDRGRVYVMWGTPDKVDRHFSAAGSEALSLNEKGHAIPFDWELWHYRYIVGVGNDVTIRFVDTYGCGEYRIPVEKDDLRKHAPK